MKTALADNGKGTRVTYAQVLVPGLYAWFATVAYPAWFADGATGARILAVAALLTLVSGAWLAARYPSLGRGFGVLGFCGCCLVSWLLMGSQLDIRHIEPIQAALGGAAWLAFAFSWGNMRRVGHVPEQHPNVLAGPPLVARSRMPRGTSAVFGISLAGALTCLLLAWRVKRPDHAILAQMVAAAAAIALVTHAARLATLRGERRDLAAPPVRMGQASRSLAVLALLAGIGFVWLLLS
jgi:hypothetical protein